MRKFLNTGLGTFLVNSLALVIFFMIGGVILAVLSNLSELSVETILGLLGFVGIGYGIASYRSLK